MRKKLSALAGLFCVLALFSTVAAIQTVGGPIGGDVITDASIDTVDLANDAVTYAKLGAYFTDLTNDGTAGTVDLIDFSTTAAHLSTLDENLAVYTVEPAGPAHITYKLVQDGSGTNTVTFGPVGERTTITTVADVSDSLDATSFLMQDTAGSVCFWIDTDDSGTLVTATDASCQAAGRTVEITGVVTDDTANSVASAVQTIMDADSKYSCSVATNVVTCTDADAEDRTDAADIDSGFTLAVPYPGNSTDWHWAGGTAPTITATASAVDFISCYYDGTNYLCSIVQDLQ